MYQSPYLTFQYANVSHSQELGVRNGRFTASVRRAGASDFLNCDATIGALLSILFDQIWTHRLDTPAEGDRCELLRRRLGNFGASFGTWYDDFGTA